LAVTKPAVGTRISAALLAALAATGFALVAIGQPLRFMLSSAPVDPSWAGLALGSALAGLPMAGLAYVAAALTLHAPLSSAERERLACGSIMAGLIGFGVCAFGAGLALALAVALNGMSAVHVAGAEHVVPMVFVLLGSAAVAGVCVWRSGRSNGWETLGRTLWGVMGVAALAAGIPMLAGVASIDDSRTLFHRFNMFVVFYPLLWLAYAALAAGFVYAGLRWIRFAFWMGPAPKDQRSDDNPPSTGSTWPVTYDASPDIKNKAA
jgi:hypothetical protein